jgi:AcrR family transcriptional regulator
MVDNPTRRYDAPARRRQAEQTRAQVLAAARRLFESRGYAGTTMRDVATGAHVSVQTVELAFGTKSALLDAVVDVALAGDDEPVAVLDRPWVAELEQATAPELVAAFADAVAAGASRVGSLLAAVGPAAHGDPAVAALAQRLDRQRMVLARWLVDGVVRRDALDPDLTPAEARATTWVLLDPVVHRRLLHDRRWSRAHLGRWLSRSLRRLLLEAD